jgi:gas vesicle protein
MSECCSKENSGNFWLGFFLGGVVGAFILFVLGTKEGKKIAEKLIEQAETYEEELEEKVAKLQKHGENLLEEAKAVKEKVTKEVTGGKKSISNKLVSKMDETLTKIEDIQKKGVELTREVHRNYFKKNGKPLVS